MPPILFEHQGKVLANEFCTRDAARAGSPREQPIVDWVERDRGRLLFR
jgi:hypothetical protein